MGGLPLDLAMDEAALHELLTEHGGEVKSLTIRIKNEEPGGAASGQHKVPQFPYT